MSLIPPRYRVSLHETLTRLQSIEREHVTPRKPTDRHCGTGREKPVSVRNLVLEELVDALDDRSGQYRYFFLASSGRVAPYAADDPELRAVLGRNDALAVPPLPRTDSDQIIWDFIDTLADGELADRLREAASGPGPAARFLQVLGAYPRARRSWLAYRQRRLEAMALEWLRAAGVDLERLGLDRPVRPQEEETGLRFDAALETRLEHVRERVQAFNDRGRAAEDARASLARAMRIDEVYHANAVRGNRLHRSQTEAVLTEGTCVGGLSLREHLEAVNLNRALDHAETLAKCGAPLTEHALRELHALLFASIDDENGGHYRRIDTRLVGRDYLPPESVLVPALLREYTEWLMESSVDPIAKAAAAQAKIAYIAPFLDGNGRIGRLLSNIILNSAGYPPAIIRVDDARRYYEGLRQADAGDMSGLLGLMIDRVEESLGRLESAASGSSHS